MTSKVVFASLASVLLIQSVYGQYLSNYLQAPVVEVVSSAPAYNLGGCGASLFGSSYALPNSGAVFGVSNNAAYGLANSVYGLELQQSLDALSVASGSAAAPGGISFLAPDLAIGGELSVVGSAPFLGTVGVSGAVPTAGQALVSYNSGPGLGLTSGGCGQGVYSGLNNVGLAEVEYLGLGGVNNLGLSGLGGYNNLGLSGLGGYNNLGLSGLAGVNNVGLVGNGLSSCGCRY